MHKHNKILIPLLAICVVLFIGYEGFGWKNSFVGEEIEGITNTITVSDPTKREAWTTFEQYLEFAKTHDMAGIRSLSHQISETCRDISREAECFVLMDSVYNIAGGFKLSDFKHIQADERQIIMYTDGPTVVILFFTRDQSGTPKVLGMRLCLEDKTSLGSCVENDPDKRDLDHNGWWDSVETLFY